MFSAPVCRTLWPPRLQENDHDRRTLSLPAAARRKGSGFVTSSGRAQANATEACTQGLVSQVTEEGKAVSTAMAVADRIAQAGPLATHMAKAALLASYDMPLTAGIKYERTLSALVAASEDRQAGLAALGSRTKPTFHGR